MLFIGKKKIIAMFFVSMLCMLVFPIAIYANTDDV
jgi:CHASE3 domain sensor protein